VRRKALGEDHPHVASMLYNMASVYGKQGRHEEALEHYERALAVARKALGEEHPDVATTLNNMAGVYSRRRRRPTQASFDAVAAAAVVAGDQTAKLRLIK
jgi:tetratricopeptide (TPR) repeat protein